MGNNILSKSRKHRLMRKHVPRDEGRKTLDSDKRKAPGSSAHQVRVLRRKRRQTEQENIPQQEVT
jgi:hypothetical protein